MGIGEKMFFGRRTTRTGLRSDPNWTYSEPVEQIPQPKRNHIESFRGEMMRVVLKYRMDGVGLFDMFRNEVESERERYHRKPLDLATMREIDEIADRAIARARRVGITAFEAGVN
jgi:hypothetical protein